MQVLQIGEGRIAIQCSLNTACLFFSKYVITSKCYLLLCKDIYTRKLRVLYSTLQISINNNWPWEFLFTYSIEGDFQRRARKGGDRSKMLPSVISNIPPNSARPKSHLKWAEVEAFCVCTELYPAGRAVKCLPIPLTLGMLNSRRRELFWRSWLEITLHTYTLMHLLYVVVWLLSLTTICSDGTVPAHKLNDI